MINKADISTNPEIKTIKERKDEARKKYDEKRVVKTISFNTEKHDELLEFANSVDLSNWVKNRIAEEKAMLKEMGIEHNPQNKGDSNHSSSKYIFDIFKHPATSIHDIDGCSVFQTENVDADDLEYTKFVNVGENSSITEYLMNDLVAFYIADDAIITPMDEVGYYTTVDVYGNDRVLNIRRSRSCTVPAVI